jgi:hypothetical protein
MANKVVYVSSFTLEARVMSSAATSTIPCAYWQLFRLLVVDIPFHFKRKNAAVLSL